MAFSAAQLQAIEDAIATGELEIEFNGRRIKYRSLDDLIKARDAIRKSLAAAGSITARPRNSYASRVRD